MTNEIKSIDQFLETISLVADDISLEETKKIVSRVILELNYDDPDLCSELTTPYIEMLQNYQESVYRLFLLTNDKPEDLRFLGEYEKECLNLKYKVSPGSNIFGITLEFDKVVDFLYPKMEGKQSLLAIAIIIGYSTPEALKEYYIAKDKTEIHKLVIQKDEKLALAEIKKDKELELSEKEKDKELLLAHIQKDETLALAQIEKDKKTFKMLNNIVDKVSNSYAVQLKEQSLYKPIEHNPKIVLKTKEKNYVHTKQKVQKIISTKKILKGKFFVDGVKGLSSDNTTFFLIYEGDTYSIKFGKKETDLFKFAELMKGLRKHVTAELTLYYKDENIYKKEIDNIIFVENKS